MDDITLEIPQSKITILAGADGAGKSSLFKILVGLVKRDTGDILLHGDSIGNDYTKINSVTGYMPERFSLYTDLSIDENLNFYAEIYGVPISRRDSLKEQLLSGTGLLPFRNRRAGKLSGGMKQKLSLISILLSAPQMIILDEPTTGVDPLSRIEFYEIIKRLKAEGKTIVLSTPYLDEAEMGDYVIFLKKGRLIHQGEMMALKKSFPEKILKILPKGNIFDAFEKATKYDKFKETLFMQGKFIKYMGSDLDIISKIPFDSYEEVQPRLEDIYIYFDRKGDCGDS